MHLFCYHAILFFCNLFSKQQWLDCKIDPLADSELINIFANFKTKPSWPHSENDLVNVPKFFHAKWMKATAELDAQIQGIRKIPWLSHRLVITNSRYSPGYYTSRIMMNAKEDWDIRREVFKPIFIETLDLLKNARDGCDEIRFYCGNVHRAIICFVRSMQRPLKMEGRPTNVGSEDIEDWIKPDWKPVVQSLQEVLAIAPVGEDLNFISI